MKKMIYKESFSLKFYFIFLFLILIAKTIYGQSNVIIGKVFNVKTNKPIAFATIVLKNNTQGLYTNKEGDFTIRNSEIYLKHLLILR